MNNRRMGMSGFTVVELVLTIVAFSFIATGIAGIFLTIQSVQRQTAYLQSATRAANDEVESLRNNNYNQLIAGTNLTFAPPTNIPSPSSGNVSISEPIPGIKRVDVTVTYTDHGATKQVEMSSLIGVIGISK